MMFVQQQIKKNLGLYDRDKNKIIFHEATAGNHISALVAYYSEES